VPDASRTIPAPPVAPRHDHVVERHGERVNDPYHWLRAENWRQVMTDADALGPEIRAYLEAEQAYTDAVLAPTAALRERLYEELKARLQPDDSEVPEPDGPFEYFRRFEPGSEHPLLCRRPRNGGREEILLDAHREAEGRAFYRLGNAIHSPDHARFAYAADIVGAEYFTIRVLDAASGEIIDEAVRDVSVDIVWANDSETFFYTRLDEHHRPNKIYRHRVGTPSDADVLVYEEGEAAFYLGLEKSESGRFIVIHAHDHSETTEARVIDADRPETKPALVAARRPGVTYDLVERGGVFFLRTNTDGAEDFKIVSARVGDAGPENWAEVVPHQAGRMIRDLYVFRDWLVWRERQDSLPLIRVRNLDSGEEHRITFDEEAFELDIERGYEFETDILRFVFSSPATPPRTFDYDLKARTRTLRKQQTVPSGHDPAEYVVRRIHADSAGGVRVPVTVLYRRGLPLDGSAPLYLYGYGAYGASFGAHFSPHRFSLVDRGLVFAFAHVRGGSDCGHGWYRDGKLMNKKNTFHDFIAAAEALIAARFTRAGNIAIHGASAGGMLVGAAMNMRPELWRAVLAEVPFVDVLNTMSDASLPLTPPEWDEWGNPIEDEEAYRYIKFYCPYQNVTARHYPHLLATGGLADPRVTYWEPAKWVAKLRAFKTDENLTLLKINMEAGHGGPAGRFQKLRDFAFNFAFILDRFGWTDAPVE
jgi:oligopeptidase B